MKKILAAILALTIILSMISVSCADENGVSDRLMDMQVKLGNKIYTFADSIDGIKAQGVRFVDDELKAGEFHEANNGRIAFKVKVGAADEKSTGSESLYVCGYEFNSKESLNAEISCGIKVGVSTRADVLNAFGTPTTPNFTDKDYLAYMLNYNYLLVRFYFSGNEDESTLIRVEAESDIPFSYGLEVSEFAGKEAENLPDPMTFNFDQFIIDGKFYEGALKLQDFLDNGWRLDSRIADKVLQDEYRTEDVVLFNGVNMIFVSVENRQGTDSLPIADGDVEYVGVLKADDTSIIVADGLTIGSSFEDVMATFGSNYFESVSGDYTTYSYHLGKTTNMFFVKDDIVEAISVYPESQP